MASQEKISVHSLPDLKNTSDDALPTYLNSIGFKQSHTLSDTRLVIGYLAFAICAATFTWDYKLGFADTKYYTAAAVAVYALLNGVLTFWIWGVEKGTVYVGVKDGRKIEIATSTTKHVPTYNVTFTEHSPKSKSPTITKTARPFSEWFDAEGHFHTIPFQEMLATKSTLIGAADPKRVASAKERKTKERKEKYGVDDGKSMDEKLAALIRESNVDGESEPDAKTTASRPAAGGAKAPRRKKA